MAIPARAAIQKMVSFLEDPDEKSLIFFHFYFISLFMFCNEMNKCIKKERKRSDSYSVRWKCRGTMHVFWCEIHRCEV